MTSDRERRLSATFSRLAAMLSPRANHRHRRWRGESPSENNLDSFLQESTLNHISSTTMFYSLTAVMFLFSYLFPFSVTVSPGDVKVIVPSNEVVNVTYGVTIRIPCVFDGKKSALMEEKWNKNFRTILRLRNGMIVYNRDYQAVTRSGRFDLIIRDIQTRDKGVYQCIGTTKEGKLLFSKTLNLNIVGGDSSLPTGKTRVLMPQNNEVKVSPGTKLVIRCPVTFNSAEVKTAKWHKNLKLIGELKSGREKFDPPYRGPKADKGVFNLIIPSVNDDYYGVYQCIGFDATGKLIFGETLVIKSDTIGQMPPRPPFNKERPFRDRNVVVIVPDNNLKDVRVGKTVIIRCPLIRNGSDAQNATWEKNWLKIGTLTNGKAVFDPPRPIVNTSVPIGEFDIVITNVRLRDEGTYQCINLFSSDDSKFSKTLKLRVPIASANPRIAQIRSGQAYPLVRRSDRIVIPADKELTLKCEAKNGHPGASIMWRIGSAFLYSNHTGPFRVQNLTGHISHRSIGEAKEKPPLFRTALSTLRMTLPQKFNNSLVSCMAVNPGSQRRIAFSRILMVESDSDSNGQAPLPVTCGLLSVFLSLSRLLLV